MLIFPPPLSENTAQMRLERFLGDQGERMLDLPGVYYKGDSPTKVRVGPKEAGGVNIRIDDQSTGFSAVVQGWLWVVNGEIRGAGHSVGWLNLILIAAAEVKE